MNHVNSLFESHYITSSTEGFVEDAHGSLVCSGHILEIHGSVFHERREMPVRQSVKSIFTTQVYSIFTLFSEFVFMNQLYYFRHVHTIVPL